MGLRIPRENFIALIWWRLAFAAALVVVLVLFSVKQPEVATVIINDKVAHAIIFFVLAALAWFAFPRQRMIGRLGIALVAYAAITECMQLFIPWRQGDFADLIADAVGILVFIGLSAHFGHEKASTDT